MPTAKTKSAQRVPEFPSGSVLAGAVPVTSLVEECVKLCIYGRNRSGKTTLACQFAKPLLLISSEPDACGGATSVRNIEGVYLQRVSHKLLGQDATGRWLNADDSRCVRRDALKGSEKFDAIVQELRTSDYFRTVVLDTATSLQELKLVEIMRWDEPPALMPNAKAVGKNNYQLRAEQWRRAMTPLLDLAHCNVVVLCQEKDHNPPTDKDNADFGGKSKLLHTLQAGSFMAPSLGSTNAEWMETHCGYIVQIYEDEVTEPVSVPQMGADGKPLPPMVQRVGTGRRARHLRLLYHPNFAAGGRWEYDPNTPEFVTAPDPAGLYAALAHYIPALR